MDFQQILSLFVNQLHTTICFNNRLYTFDRFGFSPTHQKYYLAGYTDWGNTVALLEDDSLFYGDPANINVRPGE